MRGDALRVAAQLDGALLAIAEFERVLGKSACSYGGLSRERGDAHQPGNAAVHVIALQNDDA